MTERLYYRDAELLAFDATAVAHGSNDCEVILDRSAFYPTSGGQPHDTGMLNGVAVVDVVDQDDGIVHLLEAPLPLGPVHGEINPARRHDHMQQHTAQHLLSALADDRFGWQTVSVHFGAEHSTIEFGTTDGSEGQLRQLELLANQAVARALPVTVSFEDAATATGLRKATDRSGEIRVITIAEFDRSACGGTHVASTAAIGAIVVHGVERVRGHLRVGFLAGNRVLARLHAREAELARLAETASCAIDELPAIVAKRQGDLKELRGAVEALEREVAVARVQALAASATPSPDGVRRVVYRGSSDSAALLRAMAQQASNIDGLQLIATSTTPPAIYLAAGPGCGVDAGAALKAALAAVGGRGGGSSKAAQGTVPSAAMLEQVIAALVPS
jgi:alanyl-tRNA synthetase